MRGRHLLKYGLQGRLPAGAQFGEEGAPAAAQMQSQLAAARHTGSAVHKAHRLKPVAEPAGRRGRGTERVGRGAQISAVVVLQADVSDDG